MNWSGNFQYDMTIYSPSFEDGPLIAADARILVLFCAVLVGYFPLFYIFLVLDVSILMANM